MSKKIAIVGYGGMGSWHHKNIARVENLTVAGAYDIDPERLRLARENGIRGYESLDELLRGPAVDIVLVATPNHVHKELSIAALNAGKHVVCEKPAMLDSGELTQVLALAEEKGLLFSAHQNRRWDQDYNIVKAALEEGTLGSPFYIESRVQGSKGIPGDWRAEKAAGGGMLLDWGVHLIDQLLLLDKSPVIQVTAHLMKVKYPEVDDNFKLLLKFQSGLSALVEVSTSCYVRLPRWHVSGDLGTLVINDWDCEGKIVRAWKEPEEWGIVNTAAGPTKTMAPRPLDSIEELPLPEADPDWADFYRNFMRATDGQDPLIVRPAESLRVMRVIDAAFRSAEEGSSVCESI